MARSHFEDGQDAQTKANDICNVQDPQTRRYVDGCPEDNILAWTMHICMWQGVLESTSPSTETAQSDNGNHRSPSWSRHNSPIYSVSIICWVAGFAYNINLKESEECVCVTRHIISNVISSHRWACAHMWPMMISHWKWCAVSHTHIPLILSNLCCKRAMNV